MSTITSIGVEWMHTYVHTYMPIHIHMNIRLHYAPSYYRPAELDSLHNSPSPVFTRGGPICLLGVCIALSALCLL